MATPPSSNEKSLRATGPVIVVILLVAAAFLGYYQIIYYPTVAPTSTTTTVTPPSKFNVTVIIPDGAQNPSTPPSQTYLPNTITVYVGYNSTVIWYNNDSVPHTVTANANSPDPSFNSWGPISAPYRNVNPDESVNFTFTVPGNYSYFCSYHNWMHGQVIVKQPPAGLLTNTVTTAKTAT